jgi:hypothetical protein
MKKVIEYIKWFIGNKITFHYCMKNGGSWKGNKFVDWLLGIDPKLKQI